MTFLLGPWDGDAGPQATPDMQRLVVPARPRVGAGDEDRPQVVYLACGRYWIMERWLERGESAMDVAFGVTK